LIVPPPPAHNWRSTGVISPWVYVTRTWTDCGSGYEIATFVLLRPGRSRAEAITALATTVSGTALP